MARLQLHMAAIAGSVAIGCAAPALAQTVIALENPGFEADAAPIGGFPVLIPQGWSLYDPAGIVDQGSNAVGVLRPQGTTFFAEAVPEGNNVALIYLEQRAGTVLAGDPVGLVGSFAGVAQADTRYTLTAQIGNIASGTGLGGYAGFGFSDLSGFPGYRIELLADGQVVAVDDNSLGLAIGEGQFMATSIEWTLGAGDPLVGSALGVRLINLNAFGNLDERAREVDFDQVQLVATAVPEPQAVALWMGGLAALLVLRGRRRSLGLRPVFQSSTAG